ncbi:hypothetical protein TruAng_003333 [Truncatella angustata]|nr:hypothetical protein TruAng_003333 [Truncatella angustata]
MTSQEPPQKTESILIIGAGVFGLSTAWELAQRGYHNITVVDRYLPPVPDGSSVDVSRIIRIDYADSLYAQMAREAYAEWCTTFADHYFGSGFVQLAKRSGNAYIEESQKTSQGLGQSTIEYPDAEAVRKVYPSIQANLDGLKAYNNPRGGWANAETAIRKLATNCSAVGVSFITGSRGRVISLRYEGKSVVGVNVADGGRLLASRVILSTGAWTNTLVPIESASTASGQPVGFIQLTPEEAKSIEKMPVIINLSTGVFCFPPTPETNLLKIARHGYGFATKAPVAYGNNLVSTPRSDKSNAESSYLPDDADDALREGLGQLLPQFANRPWLRRRLCWYSDTPEGHFVVDHHPEIAGLFLATGGAGQ